MGSSCSGGGVVEPLPGTGQANCCSSASLSSCGGRRYLDKIDNVACSLGRCSQMENLCKNPNPTKTSEKSKKYDLLYCSREQSILWQWYGYMPIVWRFMALRPWFPFELSRVFFFFPSTVGAQCSLDAGPTGDCQKTLIGKLRRTLISNSTAPNKPKTTINKGEKKKSEKSLQTHLGGRVALI